jgi:hypothetical protein
VDIEKHLLDKILGLSFVSKNSLANVPDGTRIASKEQCESLTVTSLNARNQSLIVAFYRTTL